MHAYKNLLLSACVGAALSATAAHAATAGNYGAPQVTAAVRGSSLPSLRNAIVRPQDFHKSPAHPVRPIPLPAGDQDDIVVQSVSGIRAAPVLGSGVLGLGEGFTGPSGAFSVDSAPPDPSGAIGATQFMQIVNTGIAIFDKTTKVATYGPAPTNILWQGFGGHCESDNDGDGVVVYDKTANRWVVTQFAVEGATNLQCVAVSKTSDATGGYWRYAFDYGPSDFPDYPKLGVWPDAYYITFNIFGSSFNGARLCAYDRGAMLNGNPATQQCFQLSSSFGGVLPADLDGSTPPPAGSPNYLVNFDTNSLNLWKFHVDWLAPNNTSLIGPINIPAATFSPACRGGGTCIPQPNTQQRLDSLADRLMFRVGYRNFGNHESLVINHTVRADPAKRFDPHTGVRWYELRNPGGTPVVYQQSTFAPDGNFRFMGSLAMDKQGNIAMGYSVSSKSLFPSIRYTGRLATDPLNTMQAEATIIDGAGSQTSGLSRWGDYSTITVDPVDNCTFWYVNEYLQTTGAFNWSTRIASFKFPGCI